MTQDEIEILNILVKSQPWKLVEKILNEHLIRLDSIGNLDLNKPSEEISLDARARRLAKETIEGIITEFSSFGTQEKQVNPLTRSFK